MNAWKNEWVFVKLLLLYVLGILVMAQLSLPHMLIAIGFGLVCVSGLLFISHIILKRKRQTYSLPWALVFYGWLAFAGMLNVHWSKPMSSPAYFGHLAEEPGVLLISLQHKPVLKTLNYQVIGQVIGKKQGDEILPLKGKLMVYLPIDSAASRLAYGDIVAINATAEPVPAPNNPYEFDYRDYLAKKQVYYEVSPKASRWYATGQNNGNWFYKGLEIVRAKAVAIFKDYLPTDYAAVTASILLGYRNDLTPTLIERYSVTGTIHVLSVSGMHMVLLYGLLGWVLLPIKRTQRPWLRLGIILSVIWLYACLTELLPPVLRASIVFSIYTLAQTIHRQANGFNIAAASAFIILLFDPMQLFDVGFQLSYLAVAGIIFLYRPITNILAIKNKYLRWAWEGTAVSLAAQIATLPLVMYYFHQMPVYSMPANLIVMVLSSGVMYIGLLLLATSWIPGFDWLVGKCLYGLMWLMHESLGCIAELPYAAIKALYPLPIEVILLCTIILFATISLYSKKASTVMAALGFGILYLGSVNLRLYEQRHQQQFIVYQYPKSTALASLEGREAHLLIDSLALADTAKMERSIYPFLYANGVEEPIITLLQAKTNTYGMAGIKRYAVLQDYKRHTFPKQKLRVDYLIIAHNAKINMQQISKVYTAQVIVFDGSNNHKVATRWMQECKVLGLNCHNTRQGAFTASW